MGPHSTPPTPGTLEPENFTFCRNQLLERAIAGEQWQLCLCWSSGEGWGLRGAAQQASG